MNDGAERAAAAQRAERLRQWSLEEGFDRVGIAALGPSEHGDAVRRWLERGDQAGMGYLERRFEERVDPRRIFAGARTALCVAWHYHPLEGSTAAGPAREGDLWAGVARYARGDDYHDAMGRRLRRLAARIEEGYPGASTRVYVDTGPVLEREVAARAGLGWVGKHTLLLDRSSSWFLLGEILTSLELEPDEPLADLCGNCTRCLDACPTGALPEPYRVDSRRCISYWTIEHRGAIPEPMRAQMGQWVFGCDVCQEVCPWNHRTIAVDHVEMELPANRQGIGLTDLLSMGRDEYVERFRRSPMKRAKLSGLHRNAAIALGNRGRREDLEELERALASEPDANVREHIVWAIARIGGDEAERILDQRRQIELDETVLAPMHRHLEAARSADDGSERAAELPVPRRLRGA